MIYLINYADENYQEAQHYCSQMARARGGFDKVIEYHPNDIDDAVINLCPEGIYGNNRKAKRYGLWRPYIIKKTLDEIQYGDYLCYCDAGGYFIRNVAPLIKRMEKKNQDIRVSVLPLLEKQWTKRDVFLYFDADYPPPLFLLKRQSVPLLSLNNIFRSQRTCLYFLQTLKMY